MIEWTRLTKAANDMIKDHAVSSFYDKPEHRPDHGRWNTTPAQIVDLKEQLLYASSRFDIVDTGGRLVARMSPKVVAEYLASASPQAVMSLLRLVDLLTGVVARYRNRNQYAQIHTCDSVREEFSLFAARQTEAEIDALIELIKEDMRREFPEGCSSFADLYKHRKSSARRGYRLTADSKAQLKRSRASASKSERPKKTP